MKTLISISLFILSITICFGQVEFEPKKGLVSSQAYSKKIATDFNYLILGENSPQQGISATLNDSKSNLKLSGLLFASGTGVLSIEADLKASNGFYFFDQNNGSEQGKITFNYFKAVKSWSEYYKKNENTLSLLKLQVLDLITKTENEYRALYDLMKEIEVSRPGESPKLVADSYKEDEGREALRKISGKYINSDDSLGFYKLRKTNVDDKPYRNSKDADSATPEKITIRGSEGQDDLIIKTNSGNLKLAKVVKSYIEKKEFIMRKLEDSINKIELKTMEDKWAGKHIFFLGFSPFYERQGFKRFSYDDTKSFADMFTDERGSTYGLTLSCNYSLEKGKASTNPFKPNRMFIRLSAELSRTSNISHFKTSTLDLMAPIGNDVNGNPVNFTASDNAFIGDEIYEFGFGRKFMFDIYYYPFSVPVGLFCNLGYQRIVFNKTSVIDDSEVYPMRLGLLFSLANKKKNQPVVTIQAFLDRTDLNLSPFGEDQDLRFGLGIGLPFNL